VKHPVYRALAELGKAIKTIFLWPISELDGTETGDQWINEGLNIIENWNGANDFIYFGKGGEMASNRRDDPRGQYALPTSGPDVPRLGQCPSH
jgi:TnpA family transposase